MDKKYPMNRDEMTDKQEREFIDDCFMLYEKEGIAKVFWNPGSNFKEYHNKPFKVLERTSEEKTHLCCLPMRQIQFDDGYKIHAYPDEIIPSEMINKGYKLTIK